MYYQIAQLSFSGFLFMIQVLFLYLIKKKNRASTQVFSEPQQLSQFAPPTKRKDGPRKSSTIMLGPQRKSFGIVRKSTIRIEGSDDPPNFGVTSNHYIKNIMKEQKLQRKKSMREESSQRRGIIESPDGTLLQVQIPIALSSKSNSHLPDSERENINDFLNDAKPHKNYVDVITYLAFYFQRIVLEQGLILLLWELGIQYYIFIPISLGLGVILRIQEKFGYKILSIIILLLIHVLVTIECGIIESNAYETFCYLVVLGVETTFSIISYILLKKCK